MFAAFWNNDDDKVEWVAGLREVSRSSASLPPSSSDDPLPAHPLFAPFEYAEFAHSRRRTAEGEFDFPLRTEVIRTVRRADTPR
ncbi:hypothetical protein [Nocardia fluminea]|uniref:hypothetical protein n=1 Tax=Nocardia fluminea TaxID=134984 RepID=UPI0036569006